MRRAMSCVYWAPKSRTRTSSRACDMSAPTPSHRVGVKRGPRDVAGCAGFERLRILFGPMLPDLRIQVVRVGAVEVPLPLYQPDGAARMDLPAALEAPLTLPPLGRARVPTGLAVAIPR